MVHRVLGRYQGVCVGLSLHIGGTVTAQMLKPMRWVPRNRAESARV